MGLWGIGWKAYRAIVLALLVVVPGTSVANAARSADPIKLKQALTRRGVGRNVKVTRLDGAEVTGVLTAIGDDSVEVTCAGRAGQTVSIPYAQVSGVHIYGAGHGNGGFGWDIELLLPLLAITFVVGGVVELAHGR